MTELLKSPLNYIGNKYRILPQLLPLFPKDIDIFVDLFCGGLDVAINVDAKTKYCNDIEPHLIELFKYFQRCENGVNVHLQIMECAAQYELSKTNREGYLALREEYNKNPSSIKFYTLLCYSFNNQIRFNSRGQFNMPFGLNRSSYNAALQNRLVDFVDRIDDRYIFTNLNFTEFDFAKCKLTPNSFVYIDSPYLISVGSYNEQGGWQKCDDMRLMSVADSLNSNGIKFGMSNVIKHKGDFNVDLERWSHYYTVYQIERDYSGCSYHKKDTVSPTQEVFICNY